MRRMVCLLSVLMLTGCSAASAEPDELKLVSVLGVDGVRETVLTAVSEGADNATCRGDDFEQARDEIRWSGQGAELSLTGVCYIVVGAQADLESVLAAATEDAELGVSAYVWVAEGRAADVLNGCEDPSSDLRLLILKGSSAPTVAQALASVVTHGAVRLPCLGEVNGRVMERGEVVWRRK